MVVMIRAAMSPAIVRCSADLGLSLANSAESRNRGDDGAPPSHLLSTSFSAYTGAASAPSVNEESAKGVEEEFQYLIIQRLLCDT
jgi:hypothetical protein